MLEFKLEGGGSCPEQYDVYLGREIVAYLRLRHGDFTAQCPDVGGEVVYESQTVGDGSFLEGEREKEINAALEKVEEWIRGQSPPITSPVESEKVEETG